MQNEFKNKAITSRDKDFAQWYTDVVLKAGLVDYGAARGSMVIKPYGYAIWELIVEHLNREFKRTGHQNVYMPCLIPESMLAKEANHISGFAPEALWVTHGGNEKLTEKLALRPTSEAVFCSHFKDLVQSYRDLPVLYNQWANVFRNEKTTRPFLRTSEFLWQEGHTLHANEDEARAETIQMLNIYENMFSSVFCTPAFVGQKTESEKFAGAVDTYTVEVMMHNGYALQSATSHYLGTGFSKAFDIKYLSKDQKLEYPHYTSWGCTTRMIGGLVMTHGDDNGLRLPPAVAPIQIVIIPVAMHKEGVLEKAQELADELGKHYRVHLDDTDATPGFKFAEYEMKGVPVRIELGPRDIEAGRCIAVRRDTGQKSEIGLELLEHVIGGLLDSIALTLFTQAQNNRNEKTYKVSNYAEFEEIAKSKDGFIESYWCGEHACEKKVKEDFNIKSRCMPFDQDEAECANEKCAICGKQAKKRIYWAKQY
ncbi:MAG: proline--tRNA ligase [Firmicutes bacterium]|nr:proline--tRNA ligase [Bacillota bacterium]